MKYLYILFQMRIILQVIILPRSTNLQVIPMENFVKSSMTF